MKPDSGAVLPVVAILDDLRAALDARGVAVLVAEPGAGKTTCVPLHLLDGCTKCIWLTAPRRVAARAAAMRLAGSRDENLGERVGLHTRDERHESAVTRLLVLTEGMALKRLVDDPGLGGVDLVILDEFHERSTNLDLLLALLLQARELMRPELRILVMSATLDAAPVAGLLGCGAPAPILASAGRSYPVKTAFANRVDARSAPREVLQQTVAVLGTLVAGESVAECRLPRSGAPARDVLVFLPGAGEIRRAAGALDTACSRAGYSVCPLHAGSDPAEQARATAAGDPAAPRLILATDVAETSLTIDGVGLVVDAGLHKRPEFLPATGLTRLNTRWITQANAVQRAGRAGRTAPGQALAIYAESQFRTWPINPRAAMAQTDLAGVALTLKVWGAEPSELGWLDAPPPGAFAQALELLQRFGALDDDGRITAHGRRLWRQGVEPRLAQMLVSAVPAQRELVAWMAAVLEVRDRPASAPRADLHEQLAARFIRGTHGDGYARKQLARRARRLGARTQGLQPDDIPEPEAIGALLLPAYPDRAALRVATDGGRVRYRMANGRGAELDASDPLASAEALVVTDVHVGSDTRPDEGRICQAVRVARATLEARNDVVSTVETTWNERDRRVECFAVRRLGALTLARRRLAAQDPSVDPEAVADLLMARILEAGLPRLLATQPRAEAFLQRIAFLRRTFGADAAFPDVEIAALEATAGVWLRPHLAGLSRVSEVEALDLVAAVLMAQDARGGAGLSGEVERLAPTHWAVPSGSRVAIDYRDPDAPVLAVRLQELFGLAQTPRIAAGRVPLTLHLLSPARRPVQITRDLASFWAEGYTAVRKDLRGRYPKHAWPDDPTAAAPTAGVARRR